MGMKKPKDVEMVCMSCGAVFPWIVEVPSEKAKLLNIPARLHIRRCGKCGGGLRRRVRRACHQNVS